MPDGIYLLADTVVAFDHARRSLSLIANVLDGDVDFANRKLDEIQTAYSRSTSTFRTTRRQFVHNALKYGAAEIRSDGSASQDYIAAGDIYQVVLSQRFSRETSAEAFDVYRAVRRLNPSPYMFFFDFGVVDGEPYFWLVRRLRCLSVWRDVPLHSAR